MAINTEKYKEIIDQLGNKATLVAVSKIKPVEDIHALYDLGQKDFGENYVQELVDKQQRLPADIRWHFIGHLQSNKVKYIAHFVHLIHGVDSFKLLKEINKQGERHKRTMECLLQIHIAQEETKFGLDKNELADVMDQLSKEPMLNVRVRGLMGMASFTDDASVVKKEFASLKSLFNNYASDSFNTLSMGMSGDYAVAVSEGSSMVRIGSLLFGERPKKLEL